MGLVGSLRGSWMLPDVVDRFKRVAALRVNPLWKVRDREWVLMRKFCIGKPGETQIVAEM